MNPLGFLLAAVGFIVIAGAAFNWDFFFQHHKANNIVKMIGRSNARIFYAVFGSGVLICGLFVALAGKQNAEPENGPIALTQIEPVEGSVLLEIDFQSDKPKIIVDVDCRANSTVFTILEDARTAGDLKFESRGTGAAGFVTSIGGIDNLGGAGDNWVYRVNNQLGDKSSAVYAVKPGDKVTWVYGKYKPE